jgi:hypothetical protein
VRQLAIRPAKKLLVPATTLAFEPSPKTTFNCSELNLRPDIYFVSAPLPVPENLFHSRGGAANTGARALF